VLSRPLQDHPGTDGCIVVDIGVAEGGAIGFVRPAGAGGHPSWAAHDVQGRQVWPGLVELHAHIDKTNTADRAPSPDGTLLGAREAAKRDRDPQWPEEDVRRRMEMGLQSAFRSGTVALRTHVDSQPGRIEPTWSVWPQLREQWAGRVELQAVASLGIAKLAGRHGDDLAALCARTGARLGPVVYRSPTLEEELRRVFDLAEAHGLELDFHVDETDDPEARGLRRIAEMALERGFERQIVCGHACSLALQPDEEAFETMELARHAGIGVVSLPANNLYLQDRVPGRTPTWRGVTRVLELRRAGVAVAIGGDNCRDAFYPFGDQDMIDVFRDAVRIAHLDYPFSGWVDAISAVPARLMGLDGVGTIAEGRSADFILFPETSAAGVLASLGRDRLVVRSGRPARLPEPTIA
jgi:cytosine deaminase